MSESKTDTSKTPSNHVARGSTTTMFKLPSIEAPKCTNIRKWTVPAAMAKQDTELRATKSLIDRPYKDQPKQWSAVTRRYEPSYGIVAHLRDNVKMYRPTTAAAKIYELLTTFHDRIFNPSMKSVVVFDNASLPGAFIVAVNHYIRTRVQHITDYQWYASSLIERTVQNPRPLNDDFNLLANYPDRWVMGSGDGDLTSDDQQQIFHDDRRVGGLVNVYLSDAGLNVEWNYNEQETIHSPINLGQIVSALATLAPGGTSITKQYTYYTPFTISIMGLLTRVFDDVYITKPLASKPDNSETYLVCIGYVGRTKAADVIKIMRDRLRGATIYTPQSALVPMLPLFQKGCISNTFIDAVITSSTHFTNTQMAKIQDNIRLFDEGKHNETPACVDNITKMWIAANPAVRMDPKYQLNVADSSGRDNNRSQQHNNRRAKKKGTYIVRGNRKIR